MQAIVRNKHVPITKTGHLQGHSRAASGKDAGFCMLKKSGTHNKPLCFSKEEEAEKKQSYGQFKVPQLVTEMETASSTTS
jgi:hypothetical protein